MFISLDISCRYDICHVPYMTNPLIAVRRDLNFFAAPLCAPGSDWRVVGDEAGRRRSEKPGLSPGFSLSRKLNTDHRATRRQSARKSSQRTRLSPSDHAIERQSRTPLCVSDVRLSR